MIFKAKLTAYFLVNTEDYKEYDDQGEIIREYETPEKVTHLLNVLWDEGGLDIGELLEDPEELEIEVDNA